MELIKKEIEMEKAGAELMEKVNHLVKVISDQLADGFQLGQDMPPVVMAAISDLPPAVAAFQKVGPDYSEDPAPVLKAFMNGGADLACIFIKKKVQP